jgi:IS1 family transposase
MSAPPTPTPPTADVQTAEVSFIPSYWQDWSARVIKAAVLTELIRAGIEPHSDFSGRVDGPDSETMERKAPICYRHRGDRIVIYAWGARAHAHADLLARTLRAIRVPDEAGEEIDATGRRYRVVTLQSMVLTKRTESIGLLSKTEMEGGGGWYAYETVSPIWPPKNAKHKRPHPKRDPHAYMAWVGATVAGSIRDLLQSYGIRDERVHVHIVEHKRVPGMRWERDRPGAQEEVDGLHVRFLVNARVPDGWAVGARGSDGYGEVRCV